jgi:hypothetical protein
LGRKAADHSRAILGGQGDLASVAIVDYAVAMSEAPEPLILDLLEWVAARPRPYAEAIEVWRTSCPRLTVFEDAVDEGLVARTPRDGAGFVVDLTALGRARLDEARPGAAP